MQMLNVQTLWNERNRLADSQRELVDSGRENDALIIEGQIKQLDITIGDMIAREDEIRNAAAAAPRPTASFAERILGPRDEFRGLEFGFKNAASVTHVTGPTVTEFELPAKPEALLSNFAATIIETPADGSVSFKQRDAQEGTPDTWQGVTEGNSAAKAKVIYKWKDAVANKETIAGYVPISKDSMLDYDELADIIQHDLLIDLNRKTNEKYVKGNNNTGIVGITNTTGIIAVTDKMNGQYFEAIRKMRTKVMTTSGRIPTHVAMNPAIKEAIDLYKTETGLYQFLGDGILWGMQVVEDSDIDGILVYDFMGARRRSIHDTSVEIGYANDQFIKNELSILAEHTKAFQVRYPDAFAFATTVDLDGTGA